MLLIATMEGEQGARLGRGAVGGQRAADPRTVPVRADASGGLPRPFDHPLAPVGAQADLARAGA